MLTYDRHVVLLAVAAGLPGLALAVALLLYGDYSWLVRTTLLVAVLLLWGWIVVVLRNRIVRPLQTVSNLLAALREDDFSIRARGAVADDPLGHVMLEVNSLAETLRNLSTGRQTPLWDRLPALSMPVLYLAGEEDDAYVRLGRQAVAAIGDNAALEVVPGAGHAAHLEQPDFVAQRVRAFLARA